MFYAYGLLQEVSVLHVYIAAPRRLVDLGLLYETGKPIGRAKSIDQILSCVLTINLP